jgi:hypothetical protein
MAAARRRQKPPAAPIPMPTLEPTERLSEEEEVDAALAIDVAFAELLADDELVEEAGAVAGGGVDERVCATGSVEGEGVALGRICTTELGPAE